MALRYYESFDHEGDFATLTKKAAWARTNTPDISASAARHGTSGLRMSNLNQALSLSMSDSQATWIVGFGYRFDTFTTSTIVWRMLDTGTTHVDVRLNALGQLIITRNGTLLATGTILLVANTYYYIEFKATISDTVGLAEVKLNGTLEVSYYGGGSAGAPTGDTRNGANSTANQFSMAGGGSGAAAIDYDDLYILDGTGGGTYADYLGDCRVDCIYPDGNGNSSQFDGSDGNSTDNYLLVDEATPNGDTDYVESPDVGDKDTYTYGNLPTSSGTVYAVQISPYARKTDAGSRSIKSVARLSATEVDSSDDVLADDYLYYPDRRTTKPGGGAWSISDVNSSEFGVKVSA